MLYRIQEERTFRISLFFIVLGIIAISAQDYIPDQPNCQIGCGSIGSNLGLFDKNIQFNRLGAQELDRGT